MRKRDLLPELRRQVILASRHDYHAFVEFVGRNREGLPIRQPLLHRVFWQVAEEAWETGLFFCGMLPMGFGKTTQACLRAAFEIGKDQNLIGAVVTDNDDNAVVRQVAVREIIRSRPYRLVFPQVRIAKGRDAKGAFWVERSGHSKDATLDSVGVLSGVGARTKLLLLDDVVTLKNALFSPADRRKVYDAIRSTWSSRGVLGEDSPNRVVWIQTAYHEADAAAMLRKDPESRWVFLIVRAEPPYKDLGAEVWIRGKVVRKFRLPSPFPAEEIAAMAQGMGSIHAGRGLANRPLSGEEQPFKEEMLDGPLPLPLRSYLKRVMTVDPAGDDTKTRTADTDFCAATMIGRRKSGEWDVLRCEKVRGSPSRQAKFLAEKTEEWDPHELHLECVADAAFPGVLRSALKDRRVKKKVREFRPITNKQYRIIEILEPAIADGRLRVCGKLFDALANEMISFPVGAHDDQVDALASAYYLGAERTESSISIPEHISTTSRKPKSRIGRVPLWG